MEKCGQSVGLKKWGTWSYMGLRKRTLAVASRSSFEMGLIFDIHINLIMPTTLPLPSLLPCFPREKKPWPFAKVGNPAGEQAGRCVICERVGFEVLRGMECSRHLAAGLVGLQLSWRSAGGLNLEAKKSWLWIQSPRLKAQ